MRYWDSIMYMNLDYAVEENDEGHIRFGSVGNMSTWFDPKVSNGSLGKLLNMEFYAQVMATPPSRTYTVAQAGTQYGNRFSNLQLGDDNE